MSNRKVMPHNEALRELMEEHDLSIQEVADHLCVSYETVRSWLKPATSKSSFKCPKARVDLLRVILSERETYTRAEVIDMLMGWL